MQIITRVDQFSRPVVFMLDTLQYPTKTIDVYYPDSDEVVSSNLDYYKTSRSTSDAEEKAMADAFVRKFGLGDKFSIRRKLFRMKPEQKAQLNNGADAHAIVTAAPGGLAGSTAYEAVHNGVSQGEVPTHVQAGKVIIPIEEFTQRIVAALSQSINEAFKK